MASCHFPQRFCSVQSVQKVTAMPLKTCGAESARSHLPELLERAHRGSPTVITRHGKPYAAVVSVEAATSGRRGVSVLALKGSGAGLWGDDPARAVAEMRGEWA
jgi:prevent-host-death family protein